ncbi:MAG: hypothetical protein KKF12_21265 [Proteobacteria bacterium]|nr:hypothetical protein [Desulfobacula sp.]MBU3951778.1 hypothetical protein [Pseudomonadota bacterium]MBU4133359.1 hypothetical protein [Pseudomonadota bacterium]
MEITERKILNLDDVTCNLAEDPAPLWDPDTVYTLPTSSVIRVRVPWESDLTTMIMPDHIYELIADSAAGNFPGEHLSEWKDKGASNKYKMFDKFIMTPAMATGSETTAPGQIVLEINASKCNSVHLFALSATDLTSEVFDSQNNLIDTKAFRLIDSSRVVSWSTFFMEERPVLTELHYKIPVRLISKLRLTITNTREGSYPGIGTCFVGPARDVGTTKYGIKTSNMDFSTVVRDPDTGEVSYTEGDYARLMTLDVNVPANKHVYLQDLLARLRGKPVVVSGNNPGINFSSFVVLGLLQDYDLVLKNSRRSAFNLKMEGFI